MSESARGEGGRVWVPRTPQDTRDSRSIPEDERYYFLEERYPEYGNLVPCDIATREIFNVCVHEGLSVEPDRQCVYLDLTHIPRSELDRKLGGILEIYETFQVVDPRDVPMRIFPAVHYSMGGLWADYERSVDGGLQSGALRNQLTSIPRLYAIGECDYQYHGANRLGANSLLSCIFSGLFVAPTLENLLNSQTKRTADELPSALFERACARQLEIDAKLKKQSGGQDNPYLIHQELGDVMTRAATVVRQNQSLREALDVVRELEQRARNCSLSDTGNWTNQNLTFTKALNDMFPVAKTILGGALQRDECRGAHFKPEFELPGIAANSPGECLQQAEAWCDRFEEKNRTWLKSMIAVLNADREPELEYEDVDTSLIPPRPRLYGIVGGDMIEQTWNARQQARGASSKGNHAAASTQPTQRH